MATSEPTRPAVGTGVMQHPVSTTRKIHDWTRTDFPDSQLTPFQRFTRNVDWETSPLGPMRLWPNQLRQIVLLIIADPSPAVVCWGDDMTIVYNEAYTHLIGQKHPGLQGQDPKIIFAEIWDTFDKIIRTGQETGEAHVGDNQLLLLERYGFLEETYYSWKFIPMVGEEGWVVASYATVVEVTREIISDRRVNFLRELSQKMVLAEDMSSFWTLLTEGLAMNETDIPLAILYSVQGGDGDGNGDPQYARPRSLTDTTCVLRGMVGIEKDHVAAPAVVDLERGLGGFAAAMRASSKSREPVLLQTADGSLDKTLLANIRWRGFGVPCHQAVVCQIRSVAEDLIGFLIMGLNPRKPYNSDYRKFMDTMISQTAGPSLVSSILLAEEVKRNEESRASLSKQLQARTKDFEQSEMKFLNFADHCPIGVTIADVRGVVIYANETWYSFTGFRSENATQAMSWLDYVHPDDKSFVTDWWRKVTEEKVSGTFQYRVTKPYIGYNDEGHRMESSFSTGLCTIYPSLNEDGELTTIIGIVVDISGLKWTENLLKAKMEEALKMKRQKENFIDMISHEIRNPLSAMLHCSEEIISSCTAAISKYSSTEKNTLESNFANSLSQMTARLETTVETAKTIVYCIQHQRRVVDDVLTLSKLDSGLLTMSLSPVCPAHMVRDALKMFEGELKKADVRLQICEDPSVIKLQATWVLLDPSRVLQVLINLMTNAIKFTRSNSRREIAVKIAASLEKPSERQYNVDYLPPQSQHQVVDTNPNQDSGSDDIYLSFSVTDSGRGLTTEEKEALFHRFSQATPKTYAEYGGSGLGLFISRQIAEMLGGAIGVASERGKGSTFAFFVKTQRTFEPRRTSTSTSSAGVPAFIHARFDAMASDTNDPFARNTQEQTTELERSNHLGPGEDTPLASVGCRILIVEDNLINQRVLRKQLRKHGFDVHVANHGEEALAKLRETSAWKQNSHAELAFNAILMDLEMPVMGGMDCVREIRKLEAEGFLEGHVPVIAVTANVRNTHIEAAMDAGMDDVTTKPYHMEDLVSQIKYICNAVTGHGSEEETAA